MQTLDALAFGKATTPKAIDIRKGILDIVMTLQRNILIFQTGKNVLFVWFH